MDLLQRLAARALGAGGSLRPALPGRFERVGAFDAGFEERAVETLAERMSQRVPAPPEASSQHVPSAPPATALVRAAPPLSVRQGTPDPAPTTRPVAHSPTAQARSAPSRPTPESPLLTTPERLQAREPLIAARRDAAREPDPPPAAVPRIAAAQRPTTPAPLSPATLAAHAALAERTARTEPSVVHVTIDRIDVRAAAAPPRKDALPASRPRPGRSLADYLRPGSK